MPNAFSLEQMPLRLSTKKLCVNFGAHYAWENRREVFRVRDTHVCGKASPTLDLNSHHPLWGYSMLRLDMLPHCDIFATQCDISWWQLIP